MGAYRIAILRMMSMWVDMVCLTFRSMYSPSAIGLIATLKKVKSQGAVSAYLFAILMMTNV